MKNRRMTIRLTPDQVELLQHFHRQSGVPDGQFLQRPRFLKRFTEIWNEATGRNDSPDDIHHYIMTRRKQGRWFRFDGTHKRLACPDLSFLTEDEWQVVDEIYVSLGIGSDNFIVNADLRKKLLDEFVRRTGRYIPDMHFVASLVARRKAGGLSCVGRGPDDDGERDLGFGDIDQVV